MKRLLYTISVLAMALAWPGFASSPAKTVSLDDGKEFRIFVSGPSNSNKGILLVHDWFGVSPFYNEAAERLSKDGFRVIAVDLYEGQSATTHADAWKLMQALDADAAAAKIDRALSELQAPDRKVAVMGFSMGSQHALQAAMRSDRVSATVIWYGTTINDAEALKNLSGPVLAVFGSRDGDAADQAAAFSKAADEAGEAAETWVYPGAHHAFAQPLFNEGKTYDPVATGAAWELTEDFLGRQLVDN
jgi:carboxymethylenebutenolidase